MTPWLARGAAVVVTVGAAWGLAVLSALPMPGDPPTHALLRLDWRLRGEEAGDCLRPTQADLDALPPHMRNPNACLGALPPYHLRLWVDDVVVIDEEVRGGGARQDRPLTVYRDVPVEPGVRRLRAEFVRATADEGTEAVMPQERPALALRAEGEARLAPGQVLLIVRRQDSGALVIREPVP
jgi:hypothetical protein